jgi:hypothetical protein
MNYPHSPVQLENGLQICYSRDTVTVDILTHILFIIRNGERSLPWSNMPGAPLPIVSNAHGLRAWLCMT